MLGHNPTPKSGQPLSVFHGSGIQNYNGHLHAGRDIIIKSSAPVSNEYQDGSQEGQNRKAREQVLQSLGFEQMGARQQNIKRAHAQTCQWFLNTREYTSWLGDDKSQEYGGFLWVKGKPGVGKSTLMKLVLDHTCQILDGTNVSVISFFFNARGSDLEKSTTGLYRALLMQLLKAYPNSQQVLDNINDGHQRSIKPENITWSIELLKRTFERALHKLKGQRLICFIDALDECKAQEIRDMISWLEELSSQYPIHVCLASRHYPHIGIRKGVQIILESQYEHVQDIICYLKDKLYFEEDDALADQIRAVVQAKASGIFIWVVLVVGILNMEYDAGNKHNLSETLEKLPEDLHDLFREILTRAGGLSQGLFLCFQWVLFAQRPLTPRELYFAILSGTEPRYLVRCHSEDISDHDVKLYILNNSRGLAEITKSKLPTVQFIHESVKDFLLKEEGFGTIWACLQADFTGESHELLKRCCSQYLDAVNATRDLAQITWQPIPDHEELKGLREDLCRRYPFVEYANGFVLFHAEEAEINNVEQNLFLRRFPMDAWRRVNNILRTEVEWHSPGITLLHTLASYGYAALIRASSLPSCFDVEDCRYGSPAFVALAYYKRAALKALLQNYIDAQASENPSQNDPTKQLHFDLDKILRKRPGGMNVPYKHLVFSRSRGAASYLAQFGFLDLLRIYSSSRESQIDMRDEEGRTPLFYATSNGDVPMMEYLIDRGADVNTVANNRDTPLHLASSASLEPTQSANSYLLPSAKSKKYIKIVEFLLDCGANPNTRNENGQTPLQEALLWKNMRTAKVLLDGGADVDARYNNGQTQLHVAISSRDMKSIMLLLEYGADTNARNEEGQTPLHMASFNGDAPFVRLLLDRGAESNARQNDGQAPLHSATRHGHIWIVRLLLDRGANVNALCSQGRTPLHDALSLEYTEIAELLAEFERITSTEQHRRRRILTIRAWDSFRDQARHWIASQVRRAARPLRRVAVAGPS